MKRYLLDTNIYGEMVIDKNVDEVAQKLLHDISLVIFGCRIIRNELRATPKKIKLGNSNLRIDLLCLYDAIVKNRELDVNESVERLAEDYYLTYQKLGGSKSKRELEIDFLIVALASLKSMDIVVSDDDSSMKSELSIKSYSMVNTVKELRTPNFIDYFKFKELLR